LATTGATGSRAETQRSNGVRARLTDRNHETKASFKTTEFWAMVVLIVTILVSAALIDGGDNGTDEFIARQAWLYVAILGGAYFISRGLAKSGTADPYTDDAGDSRDGVGRGGNGTH
jgi:di/tricarboxylate transporter